MPKNLISISDTAKQLGASIDTQEGGIKRIAFRQLESDHGDIVFIAKKILIGFYGMTVRWLSNGPWRP